ncbi:MAG: 50S ribosomal protein L4 [Holosporales bacterium]|jgi:large subunit ribosomal protein L4|nr:50S ribosomal protein L4 [Holosporales bacterium]
MIMKLQVLDSNNKESGEIELSDQVFGLTPRRDILARVVLWQLAKRRSGSHNVKGKSDVHGTTRKFVRQKGSGGARHGSRKAVQFRGGGIAFGPVNRDHGFDLQKKVRKLGLKMALSAKAREGHLIVVDSLKYEERIKTKEFLSRFSDLKTALFVDASNNEPVLRALSNIVGYDYVPQIGANVYDILRKEKVVISVDAIKELEGRLI